MKHLEIYENFKVNESIWSDFLLLVKKGEEKMFTFFAPKYVKELKDKVDSMTDLEKIMILNKVENKIKTWRRGKNLLALIALLHFIIYLILGQHLSELGISDNIQIHQ